MGREPPKTKVASPSQEGSQTPSSRGGPVGGGGDEAGAVAYPVEGRKGSASPEKPGGSGTHLPPQAPSPIPPPGPEQRPGGHSHHQKGQISMSCSLGSSYQGRPHRTPTPQASLKEKSRRKVRYCSYRVRGLEKTPHTQVLGDPPSTPLSPPSFPELSTGLLPWPALLPGEPGLGGGQAGWPGPRFLPR